MVSARKTVREAIRKLDIENGDVVLVKRSTIPGGSTHAGIRAYIDSFSTVLGNTGREKCIIVVVDELDDLQILNNHEMAKAGWVRMETE